MLFMEMDIFWELNLGNASCGFHTFAMSSQASHKLSFKIELCGQVWLPQRRINRESIDIIL